MRRLAVCAGVPLTGLVAFFVPMPAIDQVSRQVHDLKGRIVGWSRHARSGFGGYPHGLTIGPAVFRTPPTPGAAETASTCAIFSKKQSAVEAPGRNFGNAAGENGRGMMGVPIEVFQEYPNRSQNKKRATRRNE